MAGRSTGRTVPVRGLRGWVARHQLSSFFVLAFVWSWLLWLPLLLGSGGFALLVLGGFGPPVAALAVTLLAGEPVGEWARQLGVWRVPARWWAYALGLPALLYGAVDAVLAVSGRPVDWSLALERAPALLATLGFVALLGGGLEEPGWRGFALPRLQDRLGPLPGTAVLGLLWGVWHVPLYGPLGFAVPFVLAFFYTWLYNRTGSVLLCVVLHASFTAAQDHLLLLPAAGEHAGPLDAVDLVLFGAYVLGALAVVLVTGGRLGRGPRLSPAAPRGGPPRAGR